MVYFFSMWARWLLGTQMHSLHAYISPFLPWFVFIYAAHNGRNETKRNERNCSKMHKYRRTTNAIIYIVSFVGPTIERDERRNYYFHRRRWRSCCLSQLRSRSLSAYMHCAMDAYTLFRCHHKLVCGNEKLCTRKRLNKQRVIDARNTQKQKTEKKMGLCCS